jgi:hypothetical protein
MSDGVQRSYSEARTVADIQENIVCKTGDELLRFREAALPTRRNARQRNRPTVQLPGRRNARPRLDFSAAGYRTGPDITMRKPWRTAINRAALSR